MPMPFFGQCSDGDSFIDHLKNEFSHVRYTHVIFMSAWTRRWPIEQINDSLRQYLNGGGRFTLYTGNSFRSTSIEAIDRLMSLAVEFPGQVHIYVCAQGTGSFHPKVYLFINSDDRRSWLSVGSSNLTRGGMDANIEANLISTDWDEAGSVVHWWRERPDSVKQLRLTPLHLGTPDAPGPLREMFRTEEAISNQADESLETAATDLQLIQTHATEIVSLTEEEAGEQDQPQNHGLHANIAELFIKRIRTENATSHGGSYMDLTLGVVENGFFGAYPLPNPNTGSKCNGRLNLNIYLNGSPTGAKIETWNTGEGARFMLDGFNTARFNEELPQFSYKVFIKTTSAHGSQIYLFFIKPTHQANDRISQMFTTHLEIYDGPYPRGRRSHGLNVVYLRGNDELVTNLVRQLRNGLGEDFEDVLRRAMQFDPDLGPRLPIE